MLTISELLVTNRKKLGYTLKDIAHKTNLSIVTISKYEKGWILPKVENLYKLSQVYEFNFEEACELLAKEKEGRKK